MLGAILGDISGSLWEGSNVIPKEREWIADASRYTDDTVCTVAVARWLLEGGELSAHLRELGQTYLGAGYGHTFLQWLLSDHPAPYGSWGNGAVMRMGPTVLWAQDATEVRELAIASAMPTHNHPEALDTVQKMGLTLRYCLEHAHLPKTDLIDAATSVCQEDLSTLQRHHFQHQFLIHCRPTFYAGFWSALQGKTLHDAIWTAVSLGGDTDTNGAVAGMFGEALYGIPSDLVLKASLKFYQDDGLWSVMQAFYNHPRVLQNLQAWNRTLTLPNAKEV